MTHTRTHTTDYYTIKFYHHCNVHYYFIYTHAQNFVNAAQQTMCARAHRTINVFTERNAVIHPTKGVCCVRRTCTDTIHTHARNWHDKSYPTHIEKHTIRFLLMRNIIFLYKVRTHTSPNEIYLYKKQEDGEEAAYTLRNNYSYDGRDTNM